jgi:hydroxypyruvate reductase
MAKKAGQRDLVFNLISGGGSALTPYPLETEINGERLAISLEEKQAVTKALLACGATIDELNCVRKHLSLYKGGRLAAAIHPARGISLILSDVVGDHLDTIASGPTTFDATTFADADRILVKYDLAGQLPPNLTALFQWGREGRLADTPKADEPIFETIQNVLIGTNHGALAAAARKAEALGLHTRVLSSQIVGEAREVAKVICGIAKDARRHGLLGPKPLCLIFGGETTVTIKGDGKGGRNQEMALAFLAEMQQNPESTGGIYFLSAATDGNDGPTDAAGGFAANALLPLARQKNLDIDAYLKNNDAYHFYDRLGHLFKTGPTNTNVCDLQLILIE